MMTSNCSPRASRVGMASGALPIDAPNDEMTLWPWFSLEQRHQLFVGFGESA